ncbi:MULTISPECIES: hypothetical protein [Streptomyces]|uniref:ABC transporter substrate-binding protein n=1 Tax=Streptomyces katrae TaxID=68223 RepID=A0ABT7H2P6_9ACTN|nr:MULTISPECIES: hypothetical protein [Streptomyces]MDK9499873.1 hypothetical protein [Streptomyces katrae]GLX18037.1 hypothetical protein Slala01_16810 [Streptomyces lavendulae subsp. lavendulae]GLX26381.1 hypothetical protein Slala02_22010 [Streptomyces lavendulae subsp. lavendulae]
MGSNDDDARGIRIGDVHGSAFSIGGSGNTNTVHNGGGAQDRAPTAAELLEGVRELRAALVRLPRSAERSGLDAELDEAAEQLEGAEEIRPGLPARLRGALERWAPLVETLSAATALGGLLASLGG